MSLKSNFEYIRDWCNHRFLRRDEKVDVDLSNYYTKDEVDNNISSATPDISVSMYSSSGSKSYNQTISNNGQFQLSRVATSGSYNDLSNKPTIPAAQVQSDWNATSGMGVILNKPDLSGYMTVEDYQTDEEVVAAALNDLDGRIKTVENADYASQIETSINEVESSIVWEAGTGTNSVIQKGSNASALGNYSTAIGEGSLTNNKYECAEGCYNKSTKTSDTYGNAGNTQHSVGIGTSSTRKNAVEVMQNGDVYMYGLGGYDGTNPTATTSKSIQSIVSDIVTQLSGIETVLDQIIQPTTS